MSLVVNHNLMAMNAARNLGATYSRLATSTQRLSSGLRVNSAADDAAGLAIRELMRSDIAVINQGIRNAGDAISMIQTAEGAMSVIDEKLIRMKELAEQAATGTYTTAQREIMNSEYQAMAAEIDRIANATDFNGVKLLDGTLANGHAGSGMKIHFGAGNSAAEDYYFVNMGDMRATLDSGLRVGNSDLNEVWRTTMLNATSPLSYLNATASSTKGYFGLRYSTTEDGSFNPQYNFYGYVTVDPARDNLSSLVDKINQGSQATGTIDLGDSALVSGDLHGETITVNGHVFVFDATSTGTTFYESTTAVSTIGVNFASLTSIANNIANMLNTHNSSIGVFAAVDTVTTAIHLYSTEFGTAGNAIGFSATNTSVVLSGANLTGGGTKVLTASTYYDETNGDYELQLKMNHGGAAYQMQLFALTTGTGDIINSTATVGYLGNLTTAADGNASGLAAYASANEDTEWSEAQNGSGRTSWDGADILTQTAAQVSLAALDTAITKKDVARANLGAYSNRLENTITNLQIQAENLQAAESRISDVDVATEMTEFTRNNILAQAAVAMLAQANSLPQLALQLLG